MKLLIQNGADVNAVTEWKETALHKAAWNGHVDVAILLLENGADVNAVDFQKETALYYAAHGGYIDAQKFCIKNSADGMLSIKKD